MMDYWSMFLWPEALGSSEGRSLGWDNIKYGEGAAEMGLPLHGVSHGLKAHELMSPTVHIWDRIQNIRDGGNVKDHLKWAVDDQNHNLQDFGKSAIPAAMGFLGMFDGIGGGGGGGAVNVQKAATPQGGGGGMNWANVINGLNSAANVVNAGAGAYQALNPPTYSSQSAAPVANAAGAGPGPLAQPPKQNMPPSAAPADTSALQGLASTLAASGPPPSSKPAELKGTSKEEVGPPKPSEDPVAKEQDAQNAKKNEAAIGAILAALPQAIALAAPFLTGGERDNRQYAAPISGQANGQFMMASPSRRPSIGEVLNSIPRVR